MNTSNANRQVFAMLFSGVIATLTLGALPVFVARIGQSFDLSIQQTGLLASSDLGGCAIGCLAALFVQTKWNWHRILTYAVATSLIGNLLSIASTEYLHILSARFIAGVGNGFIVSLVFSALCASNNPDRNFGLYTFGQLIAQTMTLPLFAYLVENYSIDSMFLGLALASGSLFFFINLFPENREAISMRLVTEAPGLAQGTYPKRVMLPAGAVLALAGLCIYFWGFSAVWAFFDPIGQVAGLTIPDIGRALGMASLIGILGPICVVLIQPYFTRSLLLTAGVLIHIGSIWLLMNANGYWPFLIGSSIFIFSLNFVFPFQMGLLATFDKDGSIAVISLIVQLFCLATGPFIGGLIFAYANQTILLCSVAASFVMTALLFAISARSQQAIS